MPGYDASLASFMARQKPSGAPAKKQPVYTLDLLCTAFTLFSVAHRLASSPQPARSALEARAMLSSCVFASARQSG
ncbi:uncharacterized protein PHACADRAFT_253201 [Phanerochaete carnosa HHB-10118-sp]|uniref:Uncharacterized protein n=1 Tax=Phanerochaete carnosa (strain HHB-10118-sp) TaxID=650164 RepID=K5WHA2_PHACS|nr:uncharacterized protein PHACADRAFT_253201 [Phanerochaete carnosa HHB-10118-sp]EKM58710.1 hypothetical protein PHACADRAFT_253201 [Phanerochaete carnosa HHB-10118-sp]